MTIANSTKPHTQPTILTGLRVNSEMTLGNFLGALLPMVRLANAHSDQYHVNIFVPDLHSIISEIDGNLQQNLLKSLKYFLAAGLNLNPNIHFYRQSRVPAHSELCWILNCVATMGELNRMTQYKDKSEGKDSVNVGIFDYPVLMAADILLYDAEFVPVGEDQFQHLELARRLAQRFNHRFGDLFTLPAEPKDQAKACHPPDIPLKLAAAGLVLDHFLHKSVILFFLRLLHARISALFHGHSLLYNPFYSIPDSLQMFNPAFPARFRPLRDNFLYSVPASDYNGNVEGGYNNE